MKYLRDYRIEIMADNNDYVHWQMYYKGERKESTDEDKVILSDMLHNVLNLIEDSLIFSSKESVAENLPEHRILREIHVTKEHLAEFIMLADCGDIKCVMYNPTSPPDLLLWTDTNECAETGDWLILDRCNKWHVMQDELHRQLKSFGKIKIIK